MALAQVPTPALTTFGVYIVVILAIGLWVYQRNRTLSDFVLGGRTLNRPTAALSAQASDMSGWLLLGFPGAVYAAGIGATWIGVGLAIGTYLNWKFVAPRLRTYTERANDSLTLSAYFEDRFEDSTRLLRLVSALVIIVFFAVYVSSGLVAGGLLFGEVFDANVTVAITVAAAAIVVYAFLGGFLAVSFTDALQGTLMWVALIVVPLLTIGIVGGLSEFGQGLEVRSPDLLRLGGEAAFAEGEGWTSGDRLGVIAVASSLAWGLGYFGQPHILARFMGIRSVDDVPVARRIGVFWVVTTLAGACLVGLVGIVYLEPLGNPETVFITLIQDVLNPWVGGILLAAVLAAIMSTADSQLLVSSSALTEDLYRAFFKRDASQTELVWVGRITVVIVAVVAYLLALRGGGVLEIVAYAWAGFGAAFGPVIIASLFWSRMTAAGAAGGMAVGALTVVLWDWLDPFGWGLYELLPGFVLSALAIVVFNSLGTVPTRQWAGDSGEREPVAG